jgi:choline-sulfatase
MSDAMRRNGRPNILLIMADQFRHDYYGAAGATWVRTPNIDSIAARGTRFTRCFSNAPVCSPARIGLACGMQPSHVGSVDNQSFLPATVRTYYQRLRDADYRVGCAGKLDLAKPDEWNGARGDRPCCYTYGFTHPVEIEGKMHAGKHAEPRGPYGLWLRERGLYDAFHADYTQRSRHGWICGPDGCRDSVLPAEAWADSYVGQRAVQWLRDATDDYPWHLFVSFVGPHDPYDPPAEYGRRYRDAAMPAAIAPAGEHKPRHVHRKMLSLTPEQIAITRRQYCASIEAIDEQIGRVLAAVAQRGWLDNTFVIFSSDHGEMLGDHGLYDKSVAYEASLRVPLVAAGPGIRAGAASDAMVELIDVNATICELAGLGPQENVDALSLAPLLRGSAQQHRANTVACLRHWRAIRTERWKLIDNYNDLTELYDLAADPHEQVNLAADNRDVVAALRREMIDRYTERKWRR